MNQSNFWIPTMDGSVSKLLWSPYWRYDSMYWPTGLILFAHLEFICLWTRATFEATTDVNLSTLILKSQRRYDSYVLSRWLDFVCVYLEFVCLSYLHPIVNHIFTVMDQIYSKYLLTLDNLSDFLMLKISWNIYLCWLQYIILSITLWTK